MLIQFWLIEFFICGSLSYCIGTLIAKLTDKKSEF